MFHLVTSTLVGLSHAGQCGRNNHSQVEMGTDRHTERLVEMWRTVSAPANSALPWLQSGNGTCDLSTGLQHDAWRQHDSASTQAHSQPHATPPVHTIVAEAHQSDDHPRAHTAVQISQPAVPCQRACTRLVKYVHGDTGICTSKAKAKARAHAHAHLHANLRLTSNPNILFHVHAYMLT